METIEITVRWDDQGQATPLKFIWRGREYPVESTGRRWQDEAGLHILTMAPGGRVFDLLFDPAALRWYMGRQVGPAAMA